MKKNEKNEKKNEEIIADGQGAKPELKGGKSDGLHPITN